MTCLEGSSKARVPAGPSAHDRLRSAVRDGKRAEGVPSYTIPEAAALCSVSPEHLYRLVRSGMFPALRLARGGEKGRYVIPARAVEQLLNEATDANACVDVATSATMLPLDHGDAAGGAA